MASITKRGHACQVRIRRPAYPTLVRTFGTRREAWIWAHGQERDMDRGALPDTLAARRTCHCW